MKLFLPNLPARGVRRKASGGFSTGLESGFTMMEIAICLAIIGFALVAIIGVLPYGMTTQRDNREETLINQDATVLLESIRNAAIGADYLTNYVYAITNTATSFDSNGVAISQSVYGYTYTAAFNNNDYLTNATRIIGLLSTPEFTAGFGGPALSDTLGKAFTSNHVVAYVRALSGVASEKPPQDNPIMRDDTFSYRLLVVNAPVAVQVPPLWQAQAYNAGDPVAVILNGQTTWWQAVAATTAGDVPGVSGKWARNLYPQQLAANQRELRLTFLWPQRPNGTLGNGRQTFRATIGGQLRPFNYQGQTVYFYQPQTFSTAP